jgi:hypothetical protein
LPRGSLEPPEALAKKIFPEVESWLQKMQENKIQQDIAAKGFLELLVVLRKILLQDSVLWIMKVGVASACLLKPTAATNTSSLSVSRPLSVQT